MPFYAHTGIYEKGIAPQLYDEHIKNMFEETKLTSNILNPFLRKSTLLAVLFHDFGKLDSDAQKILCQTSHVTDDKMINHVDAGVAWCLRKYNESKDLVFIYAAYFIHAHHIGLVDREKIFDETFDLTSFSVEAIVKDSFRDNKFNPKCQKEVSSHFDETLDDISQIQESLLKQEINYTLDLSYEESTVQPVDLRMAMSVLIEADHGDTSRHYGSPTFYKRSLKVDKRLAKINISVKKLQKDCLAMGISQEVIDSRNELFNCCSKAPLHKNRFFLCAAPTGKGKTFSLMNLALRIAKEKEKERIFFIIPFTNIISQSVSVYRDAIVLDKEDPNYVVNEIHSKMEFDNFLLRKYTQLWDAPINISTSVQFFNSLFSNKTGAMRKLKQFANSVIVFDEYHTSLPQHLWKVALRTLKDMTEQYNIDVVFGSGTHVLYWDMDDDNDMDVLNVVPDTTFDEFKNYEKERISFNDLGVIANDTAFYDQFKSLATVDGKLIGNTIIVTNTVANAVYMAKYFMDNTRWEVYHMSSYLTPADREVVLADIHKALKDDKPILLVSTSVVECGLDFFFDIGFREKASMMSVIQFAGRVNRNKNILNAPVYEWQFDPAFLNDNTNPFSRHPGMTPSINARAGIEVDPDNCTAVIQNEIRASNQSDLTNTENMFLFKQMKESFIVIDNLTETVIVNADVVNQITKGDFVPPYIINRNSVSIYRNKIDPQNGKWAGFVDTIEYNGRDIYYWTGPYDKDCFGIFEADM